MKEQNKSKSISWKLKFYTLWGGQSISVLSSNILQMVLIWHLTLQTGSVAILSLASFVAFLPMAILGLFAGTMVDRWNRKVTMICADLSIAVASLVLALFALFAEIPIWLVLVILFLRSIGTAFHAPAISAVTPLLVPESHLEKCNGMIQSMQSFGFIAGVSSAAILYPIWSISALIMLDVAGALIASILTIFIPIPKVSMESKGVLQDMKEGYHAIRKNDGLFVLLWVGAIFTFIYTPINALFPLMSLDYFSGTTTMASIVEVAFAGGMIIGGAILGIWGGFKCRSRTITIAIIVIGIAIFGSGMLPTSGFIVFCIFSGIAGFAVPYYTSIYIALMQEKIEPQYLGRVFGLYGTVMGFAMPGGLILSGLFGDFIGVNNYFTLSGIFFVVLAVFIMCNKAIRLIE